MKKFVLPAIFLALFVPTTVFASGCSSDGYTVIYVNGILTTKNEALADQKELAQRFQQKSSIKDVTFLTGYNPSHLAGAGDFIESAAQAYGTSVSNYDLDTILMQLAPEVATRKILLIGHSQGTFYTNEIYDYLTAHGVPKGSVAVYNIATPAAAVGGGGNYLTSATDKVIEKTRELAAAAEAQMPLPADIILKLSPREQADPNGGHAMSGVYLAEAPDRVVNDIDRALQKLTAAGAPPAGNCFAPPPATAQYRVQSVLFAAADPAAQATRAGAAQAAAAVFSAAQTGYSTLAAVAGFVQSPLSILPPANGVTAASAFPVAKALYGSSLAQADVEDLMGIEPSAPQAPPAAAGEASASLPPKPQKPEPEPPRQPPAPYLQPLFPVEPGFGGGTPLKKPALAERQDELAPPVPQDPGASEGNPDASHEQGGEQPPAGDQPPAGQESGSSGGENGQSQPQSSGALAVLSPADGSLVATSTVAFSGTTTPNTLVEAESSSRAATTTSDGTGTWSLLLQLPEGTTAVSFEVYDAAAGATSTATRNITVDTTPPAPPNLSIAECAYSLTVDAGDPCLLATTTLTAVWDPLPDAAFYEVSRDGSFLASTTESKMPFFAGDGATTAIVVAARDAAGNAATSSAATASVFLNPVIINEIAWSGTNASPDDQWIELKNRTSYRIDLSRAALSTPGGSFAIPLSGTIAASVTPGANNPFYVVFRARDPLKLEGSPATHQAAFDPLPPAGLELVLVVPLGPSDTMILDRTPSQAACGGWCGGGLSAVTGTALPQEGGDSLNSVSMERVADAAPGALPSSWASNDMYTIWGTDARGLPLYGTPAAENSSHEPAVGWFCSPDTHSIASGGTYDPPSTGCTYLSRFMGTSAWRDVGLFRGTVGSSTAVYYNLTQHMNANFAPSLPGGKFLEDPKPGEPMFVAIWDVPINSNYSQDFISYFTTGLTLAGAAEPPHGVYRTIPFTLGP